jgi:hypothetical protein
VPDSNWREETLLDLQSSAFDHSANRAGNGGGSRNRTDDSLLAKQELYQLSYTP